MLPLNSPQTPVYIAVSLFPSYFPRRLRPSAMMSSTSRVSIGPPPTSGTTSIAWSCPIEQQFYHHSQNSLTPLYSITMNEQI